MTNQEIRAIVADDLPPWMEWDEQFERFYSTRKHHEHIRPEVAEHAIIGWLMMQLGCPKLETLVAAYRKRKGTT